MRHLANAQYWDRPAGGNTGRLFLAFGGPVCADRFSNCPLDRVLTYKNLIYLLNLQIYVSSYMIGCFIKERENLHLLASCVNRAKGQTCYEIFYDEDFVLT